MCAYLLIVASGLTFFSLSEIGAILICMLFTKSRAAFFASFLVWYVLFTSIHGRVSSTLIHTAYTFFTVLGQAEELDSG